VQNSKEYYFVFGHKRNHGKQMFYLTSFNPWILNKVTIIQRCMNFSNLIRVIFLCEINCLASLKWANLESDSRI
jgi:hypothetical protein